MKFENTEVWGFKHAIRGMRNPKNSWDRSDSYDCQTIYDEGLCGFCDEPQYNLINCDGVNKCGNYIAIGPNDLKLMKALISGGSEHRKFLRQIFVSVDITAPFYWWKEFDTYKVGTVANSCSTMHKLDSAPIDLDSFEIDDYCQDLVWWIDDTGDSNPVPWDIKDEIEDHIMFLERLRQKYLETKDKRYWKELVRWLPEGWLQKRTITLNYENLYAMIHQRCNHKLNEWSGKDDPTKPNFIAWAKTLPYAEVLLFDNLK